jgi:hypothetical protein
MLLVVEMIFVFVFFVLLSVSVSIHLEVISLNPFYYVLVFSVSSFLVLYLAVLLSVFAFLHR